MKQRLLFFDVGRIIAITLIVSFHFAVFLRIGALNFFGFIGTTLFVLISGSILEYTHSTIKTTKHLFKFYYHRFIRLYPAYWLSLVLGLVLLPGYLNETLFQFFLQFSALLLYINNPGVNAINPPGYYIVLIFGLSLLFPFLSEGLKKNSVLILSFSGIITAIGYALYFTSPATCPLLWFKPLLLSISPVFPNVMIQIFPFAFGIVIMQINRYPKTLYTNSMIFYASSLSYYVFLTHAIFLINYSKSLFVYIFLTIISACAIMVCDMWIQKKLPH